MKRIERYKLPVIKWISCGDISTVQWPPSVISCCKFESYYYILKVCITKFCNSVLWQWLDLPWWLFHKYMNAKTNVMKLMSCCMSIILQSKKNSNLVSLINHTLLKFPWYPSPSLFQYLSDSELSASQCRPLHFYISHIN